MSNRYQKSLTVGVQICDFDTCEFFPYAWKILRSEGRELSDLDAKMPSLLSAETGRRCSQASRVQLDCFDHDGCGALGHSICAGFTKGNSVVHAGDPVSVCL